MERSWTFAIDRGGTFTDVVARSSVKVPPQIGRAHV